MASSTLKLVIQRGPREGETLEFNPRSTIRIGRVARGNNVTIKDSGISSKHLKIEFNSNSGKWVITDLGSSNGTLLNSSVIKPLSPFDISQGDEIKIGEITAIRVEIVEIKDEIRVRRNTRKQGCVKNSVDLTENVEVKEAIEKCKNPRNRVVCKNGADLGGEENEGLKLGENVEIKEVIEKSKNTRKRGACKNDSDKVEGGLKLGENFGDKDGIEKCKNPGKRGACKKGADKIEEGSKLGENVEIKEELNDQNNLEEVWNMVEERGGDCLNLEEVAEDRPLRQRRGRPKRASNLKDGNLGVGEDVENAKLKPECSVSTRRTRSSRRGENELVSGLEAMPLPARKTRGRKKAEGMMEKIAESKGLDGDECEEVESMKVVENKKPQEGHGRKKKVGGECLENIQEAVLEEKMNLEVPQKEVLDNGLELRDQTYEVSMDVAPVPNVHDDTENEQFQEVKVPDKEGGALSDEEQHRAELIVEKDEFVAMDANEQNFTESMDEPNQNGDCEVGPSFIEEGVCDGLESEPVLDDERTKEPEIEEVDKESEGNNCGISKVPETSKVPDLQKMSLGEWLDFLEVYLPNQIYAATDRIIEDMQKEAKLFNNFMLQHQQKKSKVHLVTD